jgi:hypothetical protein
LLSRKWIGIILAGIGTILLIFGIVWLVVAAPALTKLPCNLHKIVQLTGNVKMLDSGGQPVEYSNVLGTRDYGVESCKGDIAYVREDISFVDVNTQQDIPSLHTNVLFGVDRVTMANVPGHGDENRDGQWSLPGGLKPGEDFYLWITGNSETVLARFVGEEEFHGLRVFVYESSTPEEGMYIPPGLFSPAMRTYQWSVLKVDPVTGTGVFSDGSTRKTSMIPVRDELLPNTGPIKFVETTIYEDRFTFTEDTIESFVSDAKYYKKILPIVRTYVPWASIGLGLALILLGMALSTRKGKPTAQVAADNVSLS